MTLLLTRCSFPRQRIDHWACGGWRGPGGACAGRAGRLPTMPLGNALARHNAEFAQQAPYLIDQRGALGSEIGLGGGDADVAVAGVGLGGAGLRAHAVLLRLELQVVEPHMNGLGGDAVIIACTADGKPKVTSNGSCDCNLCTQFLKK